MNNDINLKIQFDNKFSEFTFNVNSSVKDLKSKIISLLLNKFSFPADESSLVIKYGFPPKAVTSSDEASCRTMSLTNNELLRVECNKRQEQAKNTISAELREDSKSTISKSGAIERHIIPADNSCLFTAINFCIEGQLGQHEMMREIIVSTIMSNPELYNEAILEKDPVVYCDWIMQKETWGGGIELAILSNFFQVRIGVADIGKVTIEYFGEQHDNVIYLLYDGIHYDSLITKKNNKTVGVFSYKDDSVRLDIIRLMNELNKKSKFTDTKGYSVKCNVCYTLLKGNDDVIAHSKKTGHANYAQLNQN